jgi:hypothetical protein
MHCRGDQAFAWTAGIIHTETCAREALEALFEGLLKGFTLVWEYRSYWIFGIMIQNCALKESERVKR